MLSLLSILILGLIQGAAELLPVSSSAHVIVAEKLLGIDPAGPEAMFVLAMLHTGTMFAVLVYFWSGWKQSYFSSREQFAAAARKVILATIITGVVTLGLITAIEKTFLTHRTPSNLVGESDRASVVAAIGDANQATHAAGTGGSGRAAGATGDIEELSNNLLLIAGALAVAGILIVVAGVKRARRAPAAHASDYNMETSGSGADITMKTAAEVGLIQGIALAFRGLSRSGVTISTALLAGAGRRPAEEFSFALVLVLTPAVIVRELHRLLKYHPEAVHGRALAHLVAPGLFGLVVSFLAGLAALRWLSRWLEQGKWQYFGYYCLAASAAVFALSLAGF